MAVGAIEPKFYAELLNGLGVNPSDLPPQMDRDKWPEMKVRFTEIFLTKTRDEWTEIFADTDACTTPVLSPSEAATHPYNAERNVYTTKGATQPNPAPRFSKTPGSISSTPSAPGARTREGLKGWGITDEQVAALDAAGAFG